MPKKFEIEVFKDICFPELDSDEIAHALATVGVIKPFVEIINRNRKLQLGESQGTTELDTTKRVRVALDSDAGVLYTGRHILKDHDNDKDSMNTGIYLGNSRLCVVSTDSPSTVRTARHEMGHAIYGMGIEGSNMDKTTGHCYAEECVMYEKIVSEKRPIQSSPIRRAAEALGLRASQYEYIVKSMDFCPNCNDALGKSAYVRSLLKENAAFANVVREGFIHNT